jgi:hypothetical protein
MLLMTGHIDRDHTFVYENNFYSYLFARQVNALPSHGIRFSPAKIVINPVFSAKIAAN